MSSERHAIIVAITARAAATKRALWGFNRDEVGCYRAKRGKAPDDWTFICVEGDSNWTKLPAVELAMEGEFESR